jgi:muconate cycloisomerase
LRISDLELFLVEAPRGGEWPPVRALLVRLKTESGGVGWGEGQVAWRPAEVSGRREMLLAALAGRAVHDLAELPALDCLAAPSLRSAVEMACWDALARDARQPLCNLWGGCFRRRIPLAVRLPELPPERAGHHARELAERGFHTQIIAASGHAVRDAELVQAVREGAGDGVELRLDAGGKFTLPAARDLCARLGRDAVRFVLDPLSGGFERTAALRRQVETPLAVAAGIGSPADVLAAVRAGAADFVRIEPGRVGGIGPSRACAEIATAGGIGAILGGPPALGIATAAMLHLAAAVPAFSSGNECAYHQLLEDVLAQPLTLGEGQLDVPLAPGLGVEVKGIGDLVICD